jgi:hypothetical protein
LNQGDSSDIPDHGGEVFFVPVEDDKGIVGEKITGLQPEQPSNACFSILFVNRAISEDEERPRDFYDKDEAVMRERACMSPTQDDGPVIEESFDDPPDFYMDKVGYRDSFELRQETLEENGVLNPENSLKDDAQIHECVVVISEFLCSGFQRNSTLGIGFEATKEEVCENNIMEDSKDPHIAISNYGDVDILEGFEYFHAGVSDCDYESASEGRFYPEFKEVDTPGHAEELVFGDNVLTKNQEGE